MNVAGISSSATSKPPGGITESLSTHSEVSYVLAGLKPRYLQQQNAKNLFICGFSFPAFLLSLPTVGYWDHSSNQLPVPKSLFQGCFMDYLTEGTVSPTFGSRKHMQPIFSVCRVEYEFGFIPVGVTLSKLMLNFQIKLCVYP